MHSFSFPLSLIYSESVLETWGKVGPLLNLELWKNKMDAVLVFVAAMGFDVLFIRQGCIERRRTRSDGADLPVQRERTEGTPCSGRASNEYLKSRFLKWFNVSKSQFLSDLLIKILSKRSETRSFVG